jgi:4-amino-4-deoxy-L-arabinose transferase-like glycosyltransferase
MPSAPPRPRSTLLTIVLLWIAFYASFTLFTPPLLDDADSVHAEVAREMLLRHDYVTLYANGIRYLEKAPLLYWSMAASMKAFMLAGATKPDTLAAAARLPLAFAVLGLAFVVEAFARRAFRSARAGLYAALITLSSFGIFIFTRITIPDAAVCLWTTLALYAFWRTEDPPNIVISTEAQRSGEIAALATRSQRLHCYIFATACALNVLTKGLIGIVFPIAIVAIYLLLTCGLRGTLTRIRQLHPLTSVLIFLAIGAPWHILAGLANPTQGHPAPFHFIQGHWQVPLPTDGNVRGWFWFYFMNEHVLRYLNLRVPHDYDTAPLWLFWGLCFVWMMPWSAFVFKAVAGPIRRWLRDQRVTERSSTVDASASTSEGAAGFSPLNRFAPQIGLQPRALPHPASGAVHLLLLLWAALPLIFFSLSTRQEYYVLPALPALSILIAGWLAHQAKSKGNAERHRRSARRCTLVLLAFGTLFAIAATYFLFHTKAPLPNTDLAQLLAQNPGDYALSMGHFLDLNAQALGLFRLPLALAAMSLFLGPLAALLLSKGPDSVHPIRLFVSVFSAQMSPSAYKAWVGRKRRVHAANLALAAGAFGFLLAAHLGLQTFAPVLSSAQLAKAIAPQIKPEDLIAIHGEYESGSTLGFYLQRNDIHILEGRSSNLWYGSFFPDAPPIFETPQTIAQKWSGPQRIFIWQSTTDEPRNLPALSGPVYILASGGGKEIVSNRPNR